LRPCVNPRAASGGGAWRRRAATVLALFLKFFCNFQMMCIFRYCSVLVYLNFFFVML
jgi:hypothetical protein